MRDYVILGLNFINMEQLEFIGTLTKDNEKRCLTGLTTDLRKCERFTKEEVENIAYTYVVKDSDFLSDVYEKNLKRFKIAISLSNIKRLGYRTELICVF